MTLTRSSDGLASTVAANVRAELARRQMTARTLADHIERTPEWLSRRMRGDVPLDVDDLDRIAEVLDLDPVDLMRRTTSASASTPSPRSRPARARAS